MFVLLVSSLVINVLLIVKVYQDRKFNKRLINHLEWIISGKAMSELKKNHSSKSQDLMIDKLNLLVKRLATMRIEFDEINEQNKQMIASISHDFRTPLTSMLGYIQILQASAQDKKEARFLKIIEDRTTVLTELVEEFYRLSLLESNEHILERTVVSPVTLLQEQVAMYHQELNRSFDHVTIQLMEETRTVETSKLEFDRLMGNLIKNAFTHGHDRFSIYNELSENAMIIYIENKVEHPESIEVSRLFERTYKGDQSRRSTSTGLGLSIAKKIAEALNYELKVELRDHTLQFKLMIPLSE